MYNDKSPSFEGLADRNSSVSTNIQNLQVSSTEVCKSKHQIFAAIKQEQFKTCDSKYNAQKDTLFPIRPIRSKNMGHSA